MNFPILSAIIFIPLIGALFISITRGEQKSVVKNSKYVAIFSSLANFFLSIFLWYSFDVSTSDLGIVIGFSFTCGTIPAVEGLLTNIEYTNSGSGNTELCIADTVISDSDGNGLLSSGDCVDADISDAMLGDINGDDILNVQDVVILVNLILN